MSLILNNDLMKPGRAEVTSLYFLLYKGRFKKMSQILNNDLMKPGRAEVTSLYFLLYKGRFKKMSQILNNDGLSVCLYPMRIKHSNVFF